MSAESDAKKQRVAQAALAYLLDSGLEQGAIIGVGTGSTVNHFIDVLASVHERIGAAVSSSNATTARLQAIGSSISMVPMRRPAPVISSRAVVQHSLARRSSLPPRRGSSASSTTGRS
jgi:ribose 5-phosphate isomerase